MCNIKLIRPNYHSHIITPPLGLGYISSVLKQNNFKTEIIDALNLNLTTDEIIKRCDNTDIICITCLSAFISEVIELSHRFKEIGNTVVIGGVHASVLPDLTSLKTNADYLVVGEGENTLPELLRHIINKDRDFHVDGVYCNNGENFKERDFITDLDTVPFPDWQQINPKNYKWAFYGGIVKKVPVAPVITSRGCPYGCKFCSSPKMWNHQIRFRSPENVVEEIKLLVNNYGVREIQFVDDNITFKRSHINTICELLIKNNIKICWSIPNGIRVDKVDYELFRLMKRSGCYSVAFGIESGVQEILDNISKQTSLEKIEQAVYSANKAGLWTQGFFILGLPGDTKESIKRTISFAKRLPLDKGQFLIFDLYPGSKFWDELHHDINMNIKYRSMQEPIWLPDGITRKELLDLQSVAFRQFFFRPLKAFNIIKHIKWKQIPYFIDRILDFGIINSRS